MKLLLLGYIMGLATAIWIMRKQLFEVTDYPDIEDIAHENMVDKENK
jgi:hypothetical protein